MCRLNFFAWRAVTRQDSILKQIADAIAFFVMFLLLYRAFKPETVESEKAEVGALVHHPEPFTPI